MPESAPNVLEKVNHIIYSNLDQIKIPPGLKNGSAIELKHQILAVFENIEKTFGVYLTQYAEMHKKQAAQTETLIGYLFECMVLLEIVVDQLDAVNIAHTNPSTGVMEKLDQYIQEKNTRKSLPNPKTIGENG